MAVEVQERTDTGPDFLVHWAEKPDSRTILRDGAASVLVNLVLISGLVFVAEMPGEIQLQRPRIRYDQAVHIIAPPMRLTQKDPNPGKVAKEVNVEGLKARTEVRQHVPQPPRTFKAPAPVAAAPPTPQVKPPVLLPEPPKVEATSRVPDNLPAQFGTPRAPPPKPQPEPPKLAFETPGSQDGSASQRVPGQTRIQVPKTSVDDAVRSVIHGGGQGGGMSVGDEEQTPMPADPLRQVPSPGRVQSSLQLISDPLGVDFKPYLIRILSLVRRNWLAIIPESARMGRPGLVQLKFVVSRDGSVPKLVIAMASGTEAFDRAAVAGITASLPLPPLPEEFKGTQVVLQFSFTYNIKPGRR